MLRFPFRDELVEFALVPSLLKRRHRAILTRGTGMTLLRLISRAMRDGLTVALAVLIAATTFMLARQSPEWMVVTAVVSMPLVAVLLRLLWLAEKRQRRG